MRPDSNDLYARRRSRNVGLGLTLGAVVALIFAVTIVKLTHGQSMEAFDHQYRSSLAAQPEPAK